MIVPRELYTPEDLLHLSEEKSYELVDGVLKERYVSRLSSWVSGEILGILRDYCRRTKLGRVFSAEAMYQCFPNRPRSIRKPDASLILNANMPADGLGNGNFFVRPDLAVEVISPNDEYEEFDAKLGDYLSAGIPLIWIVCPNNRTVTVMKTDGSSLRLGGDAEITGETVLPDFRCRIADFFPEATPATEEPKETT